jgi:ferrochelatase
MSEATAIPRIGILLVNLGTPDAPTPKAVRRYLREFLSDPRVIEVPRPVWWFILNCFILPFRPGRVARLYEQVWDRGDSPMRHILVEQRQQVLKRLLGEFAGRADIRVLPAMTYGSPSMSAALDEIAAFDADTVLVLPLFPQYSATSTAPVYDAVQRWCASRRKLPALTIIRDYHAHPRYIAALASSVREHWATHGRAEKLLMSFHGIPQPYADKGDPYPQQCQTTAQLLAAALGLAENTWAWSFQSRFGLQEWVKPYTDVLLQDWARQGVASVQVLCPAFSADCLETLEEIAGQNREFFLHAGGKDYQYIPALNARPDHIELFVDLLRPHIRAELAPL